MPKILYIPRKLPLEQPDRCELCPLIGVIPKEERESGKRERYYCLGVFDAETEAKISRHASHAGLTIKPYVLVEGMYEGKEKLRKVRNESKRSI